MKIKTRTKVMICLIVLIALVGGVTVGSRLIGKSDSKADTSKPADEISVNAQSVRMFDKDYRVVCVNGISVISDSNGIRLLRESDGEEKKIYSEPTEDEMLFDGETVYFTGERIEDNSVKVDPESMEDEGLNSDEVKLERRMMYSYSVSSGELKELFTTNGCFGEPVYFDDDFLYYSDFADDEVGSYISFSDSETLYRYNLKTGENKKLLDSIAWNYYTDGKIIYHTQRGYNGDEGFHNLNVYDLKAKKAYSIENDSMFAYADDSKLYYISYYESEDRYALKSCSFTGEEKTVVSDFDFLPEIGDFKFDVNQQFIHISSPVNCENDRFYNIKTGEVTETEYLDGLLYNFGDVFTYIKHVSETDYEVYLINGKEDYKLLCTIGNNTEFVKCTENGYYLEKSDESGEVTFYALNN